MLKEFNIESKFREVIEINVRELEGRIKTVVDATTADSTQRKAIKDLITPNLWVFATQLDSDLQNSQQKDTKKLI